MPEPELEGLTNFLYEMGLLKRYKRTGWMIAGIDNPESIAEHSFRTAIIGYLLAVMEGADPAKTAALCLFHDTQETRIGDVPSVGKAYVVTAPNPEVTADQVAGFPAEASQAVRGLVEEYEARESQAGLACQGRRQAGMPDPSARVPGSRPRGRPTLDRDLSRGPPVAFGPSARRGLPAGTTPTVVKSLRGVISEAGQDRRPAFYRGPLEPCASTRHIEARGSTQGLIEAVPSEPPHACYKFLFYFKAGLRAAACGGRPRPAALIPAGGLLLHCDRPADYR